MKTSFNVDEQNDYQAAGSSNINQSRSRGTAVKDFGASQRNLSGEFCLLFPASLDTSMTSRSDIGGVDSCNGSFAPSVLFWFPHVRETSTLVTEIFSEPPISKS